MPIKIFIGYAPKDKSLLKVLKRYLMPLQREGLIRTWDDGEIDAGVAREWEISKHLKNAEIILLLISSNFIASDYCYHVVMKQAMERYEQGKAHIIPILLQPVDWQGVPFGELQVLPTGAQPVTRWRSRDDAFFDVAQGIRRVVIRTLRNLPIYRTLNTLTQPDTLVSFSSHASMRLQTTVDSLRKIEQSENFYKHLLKERIVFLGTPIDDEVAVSIVAQLLYLQDIDPTEDITMWINSPGGMLYAGLAIADTMQWLRPHISTVCVGFAGGFAAQLLASGTKSKRFAISNSSIWLVPFTVGSNDNSDDNEEIVAREVLRLDSLLSVMLAFHTGQPFERVHLDLSQGLDLTAGSAKAYGIIDDVLEINDTELFKGIDSF